MAQEKENNKTQLEKLIAMLKGQKNRSEAHELIVLLYDKRGRTEEDERQLKVLLKAEKAKVTAKKAAIAATAMLNGNKEAERKARNHRLIQQGVLIDLAKLEGWDRGELLGGLLALAGTPADKRVEWRSNGDKLLAQSDKKAA